MVYIVDVTAVGMRFRGGHRFANEDKISFTPDPNNEQDHNAVKIKVNGKHVAYVARDTLPKLRKYMAVEKDGEKKYKMVKMEVVQNFQASAQLQVTFKDRKRST